MLIEVTARQFKFHFPTDPHPFLSEQFQELNGHKVDRIVRLVRETDKVSIGLVAGIKDEILKSPFSAPFGGFHFRNDSVYISEIDRFINGLKEYAINQQISQILITLPPSIYCQSINAKVVNSLIRSGFTMSKPEITNWVDLSSFNGRFSHENSRNYYQQAIRNRLSIKILENQDTKQAAYELIVENRSHFGRPIYMTFDDIMKVSELWPVDFFGVYSQDGQMAASAIIYRFTDLISNTVFLGDNETGRPLRAMDFLVFNLWSHYKASGFEKIDLGISTEAGIPNEGLLRFKETHECISSLRFTFSWFNNI